MTAIDELELRVSAARGIHEHTHSAGRCVVCGDQIPKQRQHALPGVQHCVFCAADVAGRAARFLAC